MVENEPCNDCAEGFLGYVFYLLLAGLLLQKVVLPLAPWNAGHGLLAGVGDWVSFHAAADKLAVLIETWRLPLGSKIRGGQGKWALRQVPYKYVPRELIVRPKAGFGIPVGQWLRGPLRPWAESLLDEKRLQTEGYFYPAPIRQKWVEHLAGQRDHTSSLWAVIMFQAWLSSTRRNH